MCRYWFKIHVMKYTGKVQELRDIITNLKNDKKDPPKISELTTCSSEDINRCVGSLISMVVMVVIIKVSPVAAS